MVNIIFKKRLQSWVEVTLNSWMCVESLVISWCKIRLLYIKEACAEYGPISVFGGGGRAA